MVDLLKNGLFVRLYEPQVCIHHIPPGTVPRSMFCFYVTAYFFVLFLSSSHKFCALPNHTTRFA